MKDPTASLIIGRANLTNIKVNVFKLTQSLDDPSLIFWKPYCIKNEWPFIFFLKLSEGKLFPNEDLVASVKKIIFNKAIFWINTLEIANK